MPRLVSPGLVPPAAQPSAAQPPAMQTPAAGAADAAGGLAFPTRRGWSWISCWCSWWTGPATCWPRRGGCAGCCAPMRW